MTFASSTNLTLRFNTGGCQHEFDVPLYCEPHAYSHLWGWACSKCWEQAFYPDLDSRCEEGEP